MQSIKKRVIEQFLKVLEIVRLPTGKCILPRSEGARGCVGTSEPGDGELSRESCNEGKTRWVRKTLDNSESLAKGSV